MNPSRGSRYDPVNEGIFKKIVILCGLIEKDTLKLSKNRQKKSRCYQHRRGLTPKKLCYVKYKWIKEKYQGFHPLNSRFGVNSLLCNLQGGKNLKGYLENIKEIQENALRLFDPDLWFGTFINSEDEFFKDIYRTYLKGNQKTFLVGKDKEKSFACRTIEKVLEKQKKFTYFTPSIFWHHRLRTKEHILWITEITLDFDLAKDGTGRKFTPQELAKLIHYELGLYPSYVWETETPGNYQMSFLIVPITGTPKTVYLYECIARRLAVMFGADLGAINANNLYRKPRKGVWKFSDHILDIDDFKIIFEDDENEAKIKEIREEGKLVSFTEEQIWRHESIQMLLQAEFLQWRNHAAFTIALLYYAMGKDPDDVIDFFYTPLPGEKASWWEKVNDDRFGGAYFPKREIRDSVKSAFSGKYHGPSKAWIYLLTGVEFPFNLYKSSYIKKENGYISGDATRRKIIDWVRENDGVTIKQPELAHQLGLKERSLKRKIKELKDEGVIDFETKKGRHSSGTTFHYTYQAHEKFQIVEDHKFNLDDVIDYFEEPKQA